MRQQYRARRRTVGDQRTVPPGGAGHRLFTPASSHARSHRNQRRPASPASAGKVGAAMALVALCSGPQFAQLTGTICLVIERAHPRHPHPPRSARRLKPLAGHLVAIASTQNLLPLGSARSMGLGSRAGRAYDLTGVIGPLGSSAAWGVSRWCWDAVSREDDGPPARPAIMHAIRLGEPASPAGRTDQWRAVCPHHRGSGEKVRADGHRP